jgi:hypothetical protein
MVRPLVPSRYAFAFVLYISILGAALPVLAADEVTEWNEIATATAARSGLSTIPPIEARVYAITQAAVHDALNAVQRRFRPYALRNFRTPGASPEAAVATAAYRVLSDQFGQLTAIGLPAQETALYAAYTSALKKIPDGRAKEEGIAVGSTADCRYPCTASRGRMEYTTSPGFRLSAGDASGRVPVYASFYLCSAAAMGRRAAVCAAKQP